MTIIETAVAEILEQGYTIVPDLVTGDRLAQMQAAAETFLSQQSWDTIDLDGKPLKGRYFKGLINTTRAFDDVMVDRTVLAIVNRLFEHPFSTAFPHETEMQAYKLAQARFGEGIHLSAGLKDAVPREGWRTLHQDIKLPVPRPHRPVICNTLLALDPFTKEGGATCVVPGSHRWSEPIRQDVETVSVEMDAGSMVLFDGCIWHGHTPNYTFDQGRRTLNLNYTCRWLNAFGNHPLAAEDLALISPALRQLL